MHQSFRKYIATTGAIIAASTNLYAQTDEAKSTADIMLSKMHTASGVPGISVAVARQGKILWQGSAGMRDQAKGLAVDRTTAFRFASVSKVFAATLAAKLVEEGKLNPDLPISRYKKGLPEHFQEITIRQLLSHTSGMPHYQARDENRGDKHYSSVTDALEVIGNRPLLAAPGESYVYSSHAYTLLSAVLESVAEDEYLRLVERHLTRPIGIRSIGAEDITKPKATRSNIYELTADGAVEITPRGDYSYSWAGAGFEGNASDLALFGSNLAAGNILKPETISYIQELSRTNSGESVGTNNYRMGFGWRVSTDHTGRQYVHHSGAIEGGRSTIIFYPEEGLSVAVLANSGWVASIARTATVFAMPFFDRSFTSAHSLEKQSTQNGTFTDQSVTARVGVDCSSQKGMLETTGAFSDYLKKYNHYAGPTGSWELTCAAQLGGINYYALATPIGLVSLKLENQTLSNFKDTLTLPLMQ